jgi:hypothetical protein
MKKIGINDAHTLLCNTAVLQHMPYSSLRLSHGTQLGFIAKFATHGAEAQLSCEG